MPSSNLPIAEERTYRIERTWHHGTARYEYRCYMRTVRSVVISDEEELLNRGGDQEWAEREAAHLGIEIEDQE